MAICFVASVSAALLAAICLSVIAAPAQQKPQRKHFRKERLPRPVRMDVGFELRRDPATGELRYLRAGSAGNALEAAAAAPVLRIGVNLVEVGCNVFAPDGTELRGLTRGDFRVFEDDVEQRIAYFDASSEPLHLAVVLDASPSVLRDENEMKEAARTLVENLNPLDEVAVVAFAAHTYLELPFSRDRAQLERAIASVDVRRFAADTGGSNIYQAVYLTARQLFAGLSDRKAIVLLTDGQDSGLGLTWDPASAAPHSGRPTDQLTFEDIVRTLAALGVEVYAISTEPRPRAMTEAWLAAHRNEMLVTPEARKQGMQPYTVYLAELVRRAGGRLYFLREVGALSDVYRRIALTLRAEYTLGYYPSASSGQVPPAGVAQPGWRSLRVEVENHPGARVVHRVAYYAPASPN